MTMIKKQINTQFNKKIPIVPEIIECYIESIEGFKINPYSCTSFMILCGAYPCVCVCVFRCNRFVRKVTSIICFINWRVLAWTIPIK